MALSKLDSLYMAVVSDHSKHPHHRGKVADAEVLELHNPTCGDGRVARQEAFLRSIQFRNW